MISVTFLGTASGVPEPERFQSCALIRTGQGNVLLDAGEPCSQQLKNLGIKLESIDAVFLTHAHADHVGGLPMLIQMGMLEQRQKALKIFLPKELVTPLQTWLEALYLNSKSLQFPVDYLPWENSVGQQCGPLTVTPIRNTHLKSKEGDAFSLVLATTAGRIIYTGDVGSAEDLKSLLTSSVDLVISELAHVEPEELVRVLTGCKIDVLCLTHLSPPHSAKRFELHFYFEKELPDVGAIYIPDDGFVVDL